MRILNTKRLTIDAMLAALCAVLGYISLDLGNLKITFESLPILLGALLFGAQDGLLIGAIGTFIYQFLRYGLTATTVLWILPYVICGLLVGLYAQKKRFILSRKQVLMVVILNELLITILNTGVMYIDSKLFGYYSFVYIFGSFFLRLVICVGKAAAFGILLPKLIAVLRRTVVQYNECEQ